MDPKLKALLIRMGMDANLTDEQALTWMKDNNLEGVRLTDPKPAAPSVDSAAVARDERKRVTEILNMGERTGFQAEAAQAVAEGATLDAFCREVLMKQGAAQAVPQGAPEIGMDEKEVRQYSLVAAMRAATANGGTLPGGSLEREASDATAKALGRDPEGFFIPPEVERAQMTIDSYHLQRAARLVHERADLQASINTLGGYTVGTDVLGGSLIELLRNQTVIAQAGARMLSGLQGDVAIPKQAGGATAYWLAETGTKTKSNAKYAQVALTPHRLGALAGYTKQLLAQSSIDVEAFVRMDLMAVLAIAKDLAAINGSGASGQPKGLLNLPTAEGVNKITFGGSPTWAKVVEFETQCAVDNALRGNPMWITTPGVRGSWKTTLKASGVAGYLWPEANTPNGYGAMVTNQVPSNKVLFGNWDARRTRASWKSPCSC